MAFLPFSVGVVAGSGAAMQLVPKLGWRMVTGGGLVMALGVALLAAAVQRYGEALHTWQPAPGMVDNTTLQIGLAAGPGDEAAAEEPLTRSARYPGVGTG